MHIFYSIGILSICVIRKDISLVLKNSDIDLKEVLKTEYVSVGILHCELIQKKFLQMLVTKLFNGGQAENESSLSLSTEAP